MEYTLTVYGIQFRPSGQIYFFSSGGLELAVNDAVVVNTDQGESLGWVVQILTDPPEHFLELQIEPGVPGLPENNPEAAPDQNETAKGSEPLTRTAAQDSAPQDEEEASPGVDSAGAGVGDAGTGVDSAETGADDAGPGADSCDSGLLSEKARAGHSLKDMQDNACATGGSAADPNGMDPENAAAPKDAPEDEGAFEAEQADSAIRHIKPVSRRATQEDLARLEENRAMAEEARFCCRKYIQNLKLDMKLVDVDIFLDRSKYIFYFTAPNRIDFRELVKELVRQFRTRIELRQIGVRNETQMVGGVGNCGMPCCCRRYIRKFVPVTIKMAKEQNLFLNPAKISGTCGRLLCCLAYEQSNYEEFHGKCPKFGKKYATTRGTLKVLRGNFFRNSLSVLNENNEEQEISLDDWQSLKPVRPEAGAPSSRQQQAGADAPRNGGAGGNGTGAQESAKDRKNLRRPLRNPDNGAKNRESGMEGLQKTQTEAGCEGADQPRRQPENAPAKETDNMNLRDAHSTAQPAGDRSSLSSLMGNVPAKPADAACSAPRKNTEDARNAPLAEAAALPPDGIFGLAPRRNAGPGTLMRTPGGAFPADVGEYAPESSGMDRKGAAIRDVSDAAPGDEACGEAGASAPGAESGSVQGAESDFVQGAKVDSASGAESDFRPGARPDSAPGARSDSAQDARPYPASGAKFRAPSDAARFKRRRLRRPQEEGAPRKAVPRRPFPGGNRTS